MKNTPISNLSPTPANARANPICLHGGGGESSNNGKSLGTITKLQAMPENKGLEENIPSDALKLVELFALQELSCESLTKKEERTNGKGIKYDTYVHRVNYCLRQRVDALKLVSVRYNQKRQKAHYDNVQRCGSVWTCPFCARKISEGRRQDLKSAVDNWQRRGGYVYLVTVTNRHHKGDNLPDLLKGQSKAKQKLWEKRKVKDMMKSLGYSGRITATEVTYGNNGWHPHYHILMFFDHQINTQGLQTFLALEWQIACVKAGMKEPSLENGVDVKRASG